MTGPSLVSPAPVQRVVEHDHPNPHKAARGQRKRTLEPDPVRAPVARRI